MNITAQPLSHQDAKDDVVAVESVPDFNKRSDTTISAINSNLSALASSWLKGYKWISLISC